MCLVCKRGPPDKAKISRERHSRATKGHWRNPAIKAKMLANLKSPFKKLWSDPKFVAAQRKLREKDWRDPEFRLHHKKRSSEFSSKLWAKKSHRRKMAKVFLRIASHRVPTAIELRLYSILESIGINHIRQHRLPGHCTIPDAYLPSLKLCIYVDGTKWHTAPERAKMDRSISARLRADGYAVLRIAEKRFDHGIKKLRRLLCVQA